MRIVILQSTVAKDAAADDLDTLVQTAAVAKALRRAGHEVLTAAFSLHVGQAAGTLRELAPDAVFNLVETVGGSARMAHIAPALLEHLGLPFTGSGSQAMFLSTNKLLAKAMLVHGNLPTPSWVTSESGISVDGRTYIVKSVWEHASLGLDDDSVISDSRSECLLAAMRQRGKRFGGEWFAEEFITGREFNISMLCSPDGPKVLHPAEIMFRDFGARPTVVGYKAKWDEDSADYLGTVRTFEFSDSDTFLLENLRRLAVDCWRIFNLSGYARVDFRVDADGRPYIIDVNANPCLSPDAGFAATLKHSGIDYQEALMRIISDASPELSKILKRRAA